MLYRVFECITCITHVQGQFRGSKRHVEVIVECLRYTRAYRRMASSIPPAGDSESGRGVCTIAVTRTASSTLEEKLKSYGYHVVYVEFNDEVSYMS